MIKCSNMFAIMALFSAALTNAANLDIHKGVWEMTFDKSTKTLSYSQNGKILLNGSYLTATCGDESVLNSKDYPNVTLKSKKITDDFGSGWCYTYTYSGLKDKGNLIHKVYIYPSLPYILIEGVVENQPGNPGVYQICPMVSDSKTVLDLPQADNYIYDMPFANDNWSTFHAIPWSIDKPTTSCEATALYNAINRNGIVIGSIDHSTWKSGITVLPESTGTVQYLNVQAGYISDRTWDIVNGKASSIRHGIVKGATVASPRYMLGFFDDWREGLETYGEANTVLCPKLKWDKDDSLFGWQSWGGMEFGLNYNSAMSVLDFFERELKPLGFYNKDGRCLMVLDSGWSALNDDQLRKYAERCKELGFVPGIYTTPFSYWGSEEQAKNNDSWEGGKLGEMILKANGRPRQITGMSLDPTHPAVKELNRKTFEKFRNLGFEFVKIDFMNNGSQEADSYFLPEITTGMQAYNYGMDYILDFAGDMMLDFSIAPVFPAKAHVRRIGCDAWGDLPQSMYTLNCINGSWWLDRCYTFNDPDHMCVSRVDFNNKGSNDEQEARIRYTCGLMTGMTLLGGTYAYEGDTCRMYDKDVHMVGNDDERARVVKFASNKDLTDMGRIGRSFRPVEGTFLNRATLFSPDDISVDNEFIYDDGDAFYYVVFNYATEPSKTMTFSPDFDRLGINPADFSNVTELWTQTKYAPQSLKVDVPSKDVRIYRFEKSEFSNARP